MKAYIGLLRDDIMGQKINQESIDKIDNNDDMIERNIESVLTENWRTI